MGRQLQGRLLATLAATTVVLTGACSTPNEPAPAAGTSTTAPAATLLPANTAPPGTPAAGTTEPATSTPATPPPASTTTSSLPVVTDTASPTSWPTLTITAPSPPPLSPPHTPGPPRIDPTDLSGGAGTITGTILVGPYCRLADHPGCMPLGNSTVLVYPVATARSFPVPTDTAGAFRIDLAPGRYLLLGPPGTTAGCTSEPLEAVLTVGAVATTTVWCTSV